MLKKDTRGTPLYVEIEDLCRHFRRPGSGQISDATDVHVSPDCQYAVFAGEMLDRLEGGARTRICRVSLTTGHTRVLTFGPNVDRSPSFSPDAKKIAFLSDRETAGDFQLYLLGSEDGAARPTPNVPGWVEYLRWSPDGRRILLGVAGHGADTAGPQGAITSRHRADAVPTWMPSVESGDESCRWRRVWLYDVSTQQVWQASGPEHNVWEANWCGNDSIVAIVSPGPHENLWYNAQLHVFSIESSHSRHLYTPQDQLGWLAVSPSGKSIAVVEAVCSDRGLVAGELLLLDSADGRVTRVDTHGIDITYTEWRSDTRLLLAGHRGFDTVVGISDTADGMFGETWCSREVTTAGRYVSVAGMGSSGDCVLVGESFTRAPEIALIRGGEYQSVRSFDLGYGDHVGVIHAIDAMTWKAPDGLEVQGWLLRPRTRAPHPLVMNIHGGPTWHWRQQWLGRVGSGLMISLKLLERGYAVLFPNPRGSVGRGREFTVKVRGDMGGSDALDLLSALDDLVARGIADPQRIGVFGGSYGGFMTSWLVTQDRRFAAAVSIVPMTNFVTEHLISNIPRFAELFLADCYRNRHGKYFLRSPIMHAHKVRTPTLNICGARDRCTPPEEAMQFHSALLENGVRSMLVVYPEEGHGIRKYPAVIDYMVRVLDWFEEHMPASVAEFS